MRINSLALALAASLMAGPALAQTQVNWMTITGSTPPGGGGPTSTTGTMNVNGTSVVVTVDASTSFVQTATSGSYYWDQGGPAPYTGGQYTTNNGTMTGQTLADAPSDNSIIAFNVPTMVTVNFSRAVSNVYMALVSWNDDGIVNFSSPFQLVSSGQGHFGQGIFTGVSATGFTGSGELHGVIEFTGPISTLTFDTTGTENWHGILFGSEALAVIGVPEPASWAMMIVGIGAVGVALRRRSSVTTRIRYS